MQNLIQTIAMGGLFTENYQYFGQVSYERLSKPIPNALNPDP
jgi:hypothetical protein